MPVNNDDYYRVKPINQTNELERFHREKTKKLTKGYNQYDKSKKKYNDKSFFEILNDQMAKKK